VPAKLYEYLRAQRPVLAVVGPGASRDLVEELQAGWPADPQDQHALDRTVQDVISHWRKGKMAQKTVNMNDIRRYSRENLSRELASLFDRLIRERHA
jgi:hypothetical protein